jgi:hypothetical protein
MTNFQAEHFQGDPPWIAPGFTVLCAGLPGDGANAPAGAAGAQGLVLVCSPQQPKGPLPDTCAALQCDIGHLPLLSHAVDAAVLPAGLLSDDAPQAEARRVLTPGGTLVALLTDGTSVPALAGGLRGLGFAVELPAPGDGVLLATAPHTGEGLP